VGGNTINTPGVKSIINMISNMVGIPLPVGDIISKGAEIVSVGADVRALKRTSLKIPISSTSKAASIR
jgi:hypothetical protein